MINKYIIQNSKPPSQFMTTLIRGSEFSHFFIYLGMLSDLPQFK